MPLVSHPTALHRNRAVGRTKPYLACLFAQDMPFMYRPPNHPTHKHKSEACSTAYHPCVTPVKGTTKLMCQTNLSFTISGTDSQPTDCAALV
eukprot:1157257-Pelagomonas_calceolata.AAC.10